MLDPARQSVQDLLIAFREGNSGAGTALMELMYPELRQLAVSLLRREQSGHSWQPTVLVNEFYLQLINIQALKPSEANRSNERAAFFGLAGQVMRRLLMQHARPLSKKVQKVPIFEELCAQSDSSILEIENLLTKLAEIKPELRSVVEMKVFEGLTASEIAGRLGCATVTANRYWQFARHWLQKQWAL